MKKRLSTVTSIALLIFTVACGASDESSDEQGDDGKTEDVQACEYMMLGPSITIGAGDNEANAPTLEGWEDKRVDFTLVNDGAGDYLGYTIFEAPEAGDYVFFLGGNIYFQLGQDYDHSNRGVPGCPLVSKKMTYPLEAGEHTLYIMSEEEIASVVVKTADDVE